MQRSLSTAVLVVACLLVSTTFAQKKGHKLIQMAWLRDDAAKKKGLRSASGTMKERDEALKEHSSATLTTD